jgi:SAM-dependent methyltransferase
MAQVINHLRTDWELDLLRFDDHEHPYGWQWSGDDLMKELLPTIKPILNGHVLEYGCGGGKWTKWLIDECQVKVTGIDISNAMLKKSSDYEPRANYKLCPGDSIPFPNKTFDWCFSWDVFLHLPEMLMVNILHEVIRACKSGIIFALPNPNLVSGGQWYLEALSRRGWEHLYRGGYMSYYVPEQIICLMKLIGFRSVEVLVSTSYDRDQLYLGRV